MDAVILVLIKFKLQMRQSLNLTRQIKKASNTSLVRLTKILCLIKELQQIEIPFFIQKFLANSGFKNYNSIL